MTSEPTTPGASAVPDGVLVSVGETEITFADVVLAGYITGEWDALVRRCASARRSSAATEVGALELRRAAERFRRERHLEAGHDLHTWLDERGLSQADWEAHLRRHVLTDDASGPAPRLEDLDAEFTSALHTDAYCEGFWSSVGSRVVSWAVAASLAPAEADASDLARGREAVASDPLTPLAAYDPAWIDERLALVSTWLAAYRDLDHLVASDAALRATLEGDWSRWTVLTIDTCALSSESAAREAIACANDDAMELAEIARRAHSRIEQRRVRSGDLSDELGSLLLSSGLDTALGPLQLGGDWSVVWVRERADASLEDPSVRAHATATLVDAAVANAAKGLVTWHAPR